MKRWIYSYRVVQGDPDDLQHTLLEKSAELLQSATGSDTDSPAGDGSFLLSLGADGRHRDIAKQIRVVVGVARRSEDRVVLPITWQAEPLRRLFPRFDGALEWSGLSSGHGLLTLAGSYEIPLGVLGGAIDATVLRDMAHSTADGLVNRLARELQRTATAPPAADPHSQMGSALRVDDVMTPAPILLDETLPMRTAAHILFHADMGGAPVVAADGSLVGVITERDLIAREADERFDRSAGASDEARRRRAVTVGEGCTSPALTTSAKSRLSAAVRTMLDHDVSCLVVVGEGRVVGMLTRRDALKAMIRDDATILTAVRRALDRHGAGDIDAEVQWGRVSLRGRKQLRSTVIRLSRAVANVDGVDAVDQDNLFWLEDDLLTHRSGIPA
jgi:CBS domain-containing protein